MAELYEVAESFTIEVNGAPVTYRKGEAVDPADPVVRTHAASLRPFAYPHPVQRAAPAVEQATRAPGERRR